MFLGVFLGALAAATGGSPDALIAGLEKTTWINAIGSAAGALAYHIAYEGLTGTTLGKRMLGLQVLSESLQPITFVQAVKRSVGFLADALFFGAIGAMNMSDSPTRQRVGDRWAETRVVKRDSVPKEVRTSGILVFAGFIVAACVTGFIFALTQVLEGLWHLRRS